MTDYPDIFAALAAPFPKEQVRSFSRAGKSFRYVTARHVMNRLDEVVGPERWKDKYRETKEGLMCRIAIKLGDEWVHKEDGGGSAGMDDHDNDEKSAFSGAFKRAGVKWGIARYLYGDGVANLRGESREPQSSAVPPAEVKPNGSKAKDDRSFWTLLTDEVARKNSAIQADHPDLDEPVSPLGMLDHMLGWTYDREWHPWDLAKEEIPDGKKVGILNGLYAVKDKRNPMRAEFKRVLEGAYNDVLGRFTEAGTRGPR